MSRKAHGQLRRGQVITTYGPGALIDLPRHSAIVGGLDQWPRTTDLHEIHEPRLARKLRQMTGVANPQLFSPPAAPSDPQAKPIGIRAWRFPEWFVVQEKASGDDRQLRARRLVSRKALDEKGRFDGCKVVATRFVRACPRGHVDDVDWHRFVHGIEDPCKRQLWLDERGTSGDLADLAIRCECGKRRELYEATLIENVPLGTCRGTRPWLGRHSAEDCNQPSRLLIRTASNAWFPQVVSTLSLPDRGRAIDGVIESLWDDLCIVQDIAGLTFIKQKPRVVRELSSFSDVEVLAAIESRRRGTADERPVKLVELDALLSAPEGYGDDVPVDPDFHARRLPEHAWRHATWTSGIESVIALHRLREVLALAGFTRLEAVMPDVNGEYETDVERASLAIEPKWFPAVENRGEGIFIQVRAEAIRDWLDRESVRRRLEGLAAGHRQWAEDRASKRDFPGGQYLLLHTLSHLLIQSLALRCGYPTTSIRERVYADPVGSRYGVLLYTASPDGDGTLGGLVQQARHLESHLGHALRMAAFCSNDPICASHVPGSSFEQRWLHGAACHGCTLIAETSCEMRNDYLDRALVVPVIGVTDTAFFSVPS